jgi:arylsulfatase A-like enzyme
VEVALRFIRDCVQKKQRFLAVVWFGSPHDPHQALPADQEQYRELAEKERNFCGEITAMDRAFGRLRSSIKELGVRDNTLLWYCSDNGALPRVGSSGGRRGNKGQIYEGGLLVPALLEWPAKIKEPRVVALPAVTSDIYPTVLELTGTTVAQQPPLDGTSLAAMLTGSTDRRARPIGFWNAPVPGIGTPAKKWMEELYADQQAGREPNDPLRIVPDAGQIQAEHPADQFPGHSAWLDGTWKLHRIERRPSAAITWELYDLAADPVESQNLAERQPERLASMQRGLQEWLGSVVRSLNGHDYR